MNSQQLLYINILLGVIFILYFLFGRSKPRGPTKLNLKANEDFSKSIIKNTQFPLQPETGPQTPQAEPAQKMTVLEPENENVIPLKKKSGRDLSIYFVYNGHEWESHEVLGVPQGASMPQVTEAYQKLLATSDASAFEFYESAFQAILKRWRDRL